MELPPAYAPPHPAHVQALAHGLLRDIPLWFGHMDSMTAFVRAFDGGLKDGQRLTLGVNRIQHDCELLELQYLRGFSIGAEDWKRQNPAPYELLVYLGRGGQDGGGRAHLAERIETVLATAQNPSIHSLRHVFPSQWNAPAFLPFPVARTPRLPLHARTNADPNLTGETILLPQLPLPECSDCTTITSFWGPQLDELMLLGKFGCWLTPESPFLARISSARAAAAVRKALPGIFPGERPPEVQEPLSPVANLFGSVFVRGSFDQIQTLVRARFLLMPSLCMMAFPNHCIESDFIATFESTHRDRDMGENVIRDVTRAFNEDAVAVRLCVDAGLVPDLVFATITVEYVNSRGRHLWNVILPFPRRPGLTVNLWRRLCERLEPRDGDAGNMRRVLLQCKVCGCWKHEADVCPTRAYEEWSGAIVEV